MSHQYQHSKKPYKLQSAYVDDYEDRNQNDEFQIQNINLQKLNNLPVQQSESDSEQILQKIDNLLVENQHHYEDQEDDSNQQQKQALLNFKINELQRICRTLSEANRKLTQKLQQNCQQEQNNKKNDNTISNNKTINILNSSTESNNMFNDQLTLMQCEFGEIQRLIKQYKEQLENAEKKWVEMKQEKDEEIQILKREILSLSDNQENFINQIKDKNDQIHLLKSKNQELLLELQNLQIQLQNVSEAQTTSVFKYDTNSSRRQVSNNMRRYDNYDDFIFNQKIQREMEFMIKKLLKEVAHEKKANNRLNLQIKRLNNQLIQSQKQFKVKNDQIYQLEMKIIHLEKNGPTPYIRSPGKRTPDQINPFTPHHNKNYSRVTSHHQRQKTQQHYPVNSKYSASQTRNRQQNIFVQNQSKNNIEMKSVFQKPLNFIDSRNSSYFKANEKNSNVYKPVTVQNSNSKVFASFLLIDLQQGGIIKVTLKQKIIIICRLIDFYCKKLINGNYQNLMAENIQINNFHQKHPNLIRIRLMDLQYQQVNKEEQNEESLLWNMAFIVENVIKDVQTTDRTGTKIDLNLVEIIEELLPKSTEQKKTYFEQLSKYLENSTA